MIHGLILTDNTYNDFNNTVSRGPGAHRIATHLRHHGYKIEVVDYCLRWTLLEFQTLCSKLVNDQTLFLGIGTNLFLDRNSFNQLTQWFKQTYPHVAIVLGGNQLLSRTIDPVDYYIEGNAENAVLILLEYLQGQRTIDQIEWTDVGIPGVRLINALTTYNKVDTSDLSIKYLSSDFIEPTQNLGLETARGCIFKCSFCSYPLIGKKKVDYVRNVDNLIQELQNNYDQWGTTNYIVNEDTLNDRVEKLEILENAISALPFKINFVAYARLDLILARPESVRLLRNMGMRGVHFGIETFNKKAGKLIGKGTDPAKVKDGLLWWKLEMPHVITNCSMITGLPYDDDNLYEHADWFANSGVESWGWQPLYLNDTTKSLHSSEFSLNYRLYGLEPMSDQEIEKEIAIDLEQGFNTVHHQNGSHKGHKNKMIYWKNTRSNNNWFKAMRLAININTYSKTKRVSPWTAFDWGTLGYTLDEMQTWGWHSVTPHVPEQDITDRCVRHIEKYKKSKLDYNYTTYYQGQSHEKMV
jgi:hypothetical protein